MAELWVDFNRVDPRGFIATTIRGSAAWKIREGDLILVEDGEGTRCKAHVEEVRRYVPQSTAVAYLSLIPGKVEPNTRFDWISDDLDRYIAAG